MNLVAHKSRENKTPLREQGKVCLSEQETKELIEYELVSTCARVDLTHERCKRIRELAHREVRWGLVRRLGHIHGILPLIYNGLSTCKAALPQRMQEEIERHRRGIRIHNTFLIQELGRLVEHFAARGIPMLALKGPVLAQVAYGDLQLRRYSDLDLLIPEEQFSAAENALHAMGYRGEHDRRKIQDWRKHLKRVLAGQCRFGRPNSPFLVDLHTRTMPPGYAVQADFELFWKRSIGVKLGEVEVRGFAAEDLLVILCFHGVKNQWGALKHVVDIAEHIRAHPDLDWRNVVQQARMMRGERVLKLGLQLARDIAEVALPFGVQKWIESEPMDDIASLMKTYLRKRHQKSELDYGERVRLQLATKDTLADQLRYGGFSAVQHFWSKFLQPQ